MDFIVHLERISNSSLHLRAIHRPRILTEFCHIVPSTASKPFLPLALNIAVPSGIPVTFTCNPVKHCRSSACNFSVGDAVALSCTTSFELAIK